MIDPTAFIAPGAIVLGDVHLGVESSIWYNAVLRGDTDRITIGDQTNIQDLTMIHADAGCPLHRRMSRNRRPSRHPPRLHDRGRLPDRDGRDRAQRRRIGRGSIVGAGALLLENMEVPPGSMVDRRPGADLRATWTK